jgi:prepilin-type processing-associated H-X9-DG protein
MGDDEGAFEQMAPGGCEGNMGVVGQPSTWMENLLPYTQSKNVFLCPSGSSTTAGTTVNYAAYPPIFPNTDIGMNSYLGLYYNYFQYFIQDQCEGPGTPGGGGPGDGLATPRTEQNVRYPSSTVMFSDGFEEPASWGFDTAWWIDPGYAVGSPYAISDRHNLRSNVAFFDGHAKNFVADTLESQAAINEPNLIYVEMTNYNAANVIWDLDAANPFDEPGKWPSNCCSN